MRILNKGALTAHGNREGRKIVAELLDAGLDALDPYARVKQFVRLEQDGIVLDDRGFEMEGDPRAGPAVYPFKEYDRIFVIGAAKGVQRAALALEEVLGDRLTGGHVIDKHGEPVICKRIGVTLAGHPLPDLACVEGCQKIEALAKGITERDLVFTVSGSGCGSLMTYPAGDIEILDIARFTHLMQIEKGVPTGDLNKVRTHIDRFKGGRLQRLFRPAAQVHLTTADPAKMGTPVLRASYFEMLEKNTFFPTVASPSTYGDAVGVIKKWRAWEDTPASIRQHLLAGGPHNENMGVAEFVTTGDRFFGLIFKDATVYPAVRRRAEELGLQCIMLSEYMEAEAREAGYVNAQMALCVERMGEPFQSPVVLMTSGENVVTVGSGTGVGGAQPGVLHGSSPHHCGQPAHRIRRGGYRRYRRTWGLSIPWRSGLSGGRHRGRIYPGRGPGGGHRPVAGHADPCHFRASVAAGLRRPRDTWRVGTGPRNHFDHVMTEEGE